MGLRIRGFVDFGNRKRPPDGAAEILPAVEWRFASDLVTLSLARKRWGKACKIEEISRIECFVADEIVNISVQLFCTRFRGYLYRTGSGAPELRAVIRCEYLDFLNRVEAGIDHQRTRSTVEPRIQYIAAVNLKCVVLDPSAVHTVLHAADNSHLSFVLACLIAYARREGDELCEIPSVEANRDDFFLRNCAGDTRGLGFNICRAAADNVDLFRTLCRLECHLNWFCTRNHIAQNLLTEVRRANGNIVSAWLQPGKEVPSI